MRRLHLKDLVTDLRRWPGARLVSIALLVACGGKQPDAPASGATTAGAPAPRGSAVEGGGDPTASSGEPAPAPAQAPYCVENASQNILATFVADDKAATFCIKQDGLDSIPQKCTAIDLATGAYTAAAAAPAAPAEPAAAVTVKSDENGVEVCRDTACKKLDLPKPKDDDIIAPYQVAVSSDGKRVAAAGGGYSDLVFLDATTGKKVKAVKRGQKDGCIEDLHAVGEAVYVATSVCAGPGGSGVLYSWAGKQLGTPGPRELNLYRARPIAVGGDHWAVVSFAGGDVLVFDARTGKKVHLVDVEYPEGCEPCDRVLGDGAWGESPLVKLPAGKIASLHGAGLSIIDPATGKVEKTHPMPICPAKK